jgi:hypothetical protein
MSIDHPLMHQLLKLSDDVDLAMRSAERGDELSVQAWCLRSMTTPTN